MYTGTELLTSPIKEALYIPDASLVRNERNFSKKPNETTCRVGSVSSHLFSIVSPLPLSKTLDSVTALFGSQQYRTVPLQKSAARCCGPLPGTCFSRLLQATLAIAAGLPGGSRRSAAAQVKETKRHLAGFRTFATHISNPPQSSTPTLLQNFGNAGGGEASKSEVCYGFQN